MTLQHNQRELIIDLATGDYQINPIRSRINERRIIGPVDYGWARYIEGNSTHNLESPADNLILNHTHGEIFERLIPINPDVIWAGYAVPEGNPLIGFSTLQQYMFDKYSQEYEDDWVRIFAVGPAARLTHEGIIGSNHIKKGRITPIDDWAGRGGLGSRLLQKHRWQFLEKWERHWINDNSLHDGVNRFRQDKWAAARDFCNEIQAGIAEAFSARPEAIPEISAPYQAARLDVMEKKTGK